MKGKNTLKIIIISLLAILLLLCVSACGKRAGKSQLSSVDRVPDTMRLFYREKIHPFDSGTVVEGIARIDNKIMMFGEKDSVPVLGITNYSEATDGHISFSQTKKLSQENINPTSQKIYGITAGADGYFYLLVGGKPEIQEGKGANDALVKYADSYLLLKYSPNGDFLNRTDFAFDEGVYLFGLVVDEVGTPILYDNNFIFILDLQSKITAAIEVGEEKNIISASQCGEGLIFSIEHFGMDGHYVKLNTQTHELTELKLPPQKDADLAAQGSLSNCQSINETYIIDTGLEFYACSFENDSYTSIIQWNFLEYGVGAMKYACQLDANSFVGALNEDYLLLIGNRDVPYAERSIVNVAVVTGIYSPSIATIDLLNNQSELYEYHVTQYSEDNLSQLITEMTSGSVPDLILFSNNINVDSSFYEDLFTFIDNDPDLSRQSFLPNYLESLSTGGELHQIWDSVNINTIAIRDSDCPSISNITPQYYSNYLDTTKKYKAVFESYMSNQNLLKWIAKVGVTVCVDYENATCSFNKESFRDLLGWCKKMNDEIPEGASPDLYIRVTDALLDRETVSRVYQIHSIQEKLGETFTFIGFPDGFSGLHFYGAPEEAICMAIPKGSQNKAGAWAYIKSRLSDESQNALTYSLPVIKRALFRDAENLLTKTEIDLLKQLLSVTKQAKKNSDEAVVEIIIATGQEYLSGNKTLDDTIDIIQSRVSIYIAEQYG